MYQKVKKRKGILREGRELNILGHILVYISGYLPATRNDFDVIAFKRKSIFSSYYSFELHAPKETVRYIIQMNPAGMAFSVASYPTDARSPSPPNFGAPRRKEQSADDCRLITNARTQRDDSTADHSTISTCIHFFLRPFASSFASPLASSFALLFASQFASPLRRPPIDTCLLFGSGRCHPLLIEHPF